MKNPVINLDNIGELGLYDLQSLNDCINLYLREVPTAEKWIEAAGYNSNSGYTWLYLANGIEIVAGFGSCDFMVFDHETGEEHHAETWKEADELRYIVNTVHDIEPATLDKIAKDRFNKDKDDLSIDELRHCCELWWDLN